MSLYPGTIAEILKVEKRCRDLREAIKATAIRAGLLHNETAHLTDEQLMALLRNVGDLAHYARVNSK